MAIGSAAAWQQRVFEKEALRIWPVAGGMRNLIDAAAENDRTRYQLWGGRNAADEGRYYTPWRPRVVSASPSIAGWQASCAQRYSFKAKGRRKYARGIQNTFSP
jgi:hypothetical protein